MKKDDFNKNKIDFEERDYTEISDGSEEDVKETEEEVEETVVLGDPYALGGQPNFEQPTGNSQGFGSTNNQPNYSNIGEGVGPNPTDNYFDTTQGMGVPQPSPVYTFLTNNKVYELTIGVDKDELLTFANNSLNIPKRIGYREMKELEFLELMKGVDPTDFQNARRTYFPSTQASMAKGDNVKSIINIIIQDSTLSQGVGANRNIVDQARRTSNFEVQRLLTNLDTSKLFDPHITVPHKKYEQAGVVELYVNTTVVLLSFLGLSLATVSNYSFTVKETSDQYLVHLQKL